MIELTSKENAQRVEESWQDSYFADGDVKTECKILEKLTWAVILKDVPTSISSTVISPSHLRGTILEPLLTGLSPETILHSEL